MKTIFTIFILCSINCFGHNLTKPKPNVIVIPTLTVTSNTVCLGSNVVFNLQNCEFYNSEWLVSPAAAAPTYYHDIATNIYAITASPTVQTTYRVRCNTGSGNISEYSDPVTIAVIPAPILSEITANPSYITAIGNTSTLTASCQDGNIQWLQENTLIGNGETSNIIAPNPFATTYSAKCTHTSNGCIVTKDKVFTINNQLSGTTNANINGQYTSAGGTLVVNGDYVVKGVPNNPDADTYYFNKNFYNGGGYMNNYRFTSNFYFLVRKNNFWEIQFGASNQFYTATNFLSPYTVSYKTQSTYNGSLPPCTANWINQNTLAIENITIGGFCDNSPPNCVVNLDINSTSSPTGDVSSGTITKQASSQTGGKITATNKINGTARVTYQAKSIELNNGFKADNGTVFTAEIGGCI